MADTLAYVALGSNQGDSPRILRAAFAELELLTGGALLRSSLWRTEPVDCLAGSPPFLNAAAAFHPRPDETPVSLLDKFQALERKFGRPVVHGRNEPRPLDLDLIAFGACQIDSLALTLPHPRAHGRRFVLAPLAEIAPDLVLPGQSRTVSELLAALPEVPSAARFSGR